MEELWMNEDFINSVLNKVGGMPVSHICDVDTIDYLIKLGERPFAKAENISLAYFSLTLSNAFDRLMEDPNTRNKVFAEMPMVAKMIKEFCEHFKDEEAFLCFSNLNFGVFKRVVANRFSYALPDRMMDDRDRFYEALIKSINHKRDDLTIGEVYSEFNERFKAFEGCTPDIENIDEGYKSLTADVIGDIVIVMCQAFLVNVKGIII